MSTKTIMLSSAYTNASLLCSFVVCLFSFIALLIRIDSHLIVYRWSESLFIGTDDDYDQPVVVLYSTNPIETVPTKIEQETDEILRRQKVLGYANESNSIFDRFSFLNPPKPLCMRQEQDQIRTKRLMIIVVLSRALNFDHRQAIRGTWGYNRADKKSDIYIETIFFVGIDDTVRLAVQHEQIMFNDIVEIGIPENYPFVSHKELAAIFWTRLYCPWAEIVFRADDDILLDTILLLDHLHTKIDLNHRDGFYGWFRFNNSVHRLGKWAVPKDEYKPTIYPPYTFGVGYLLSNNSCQRLIIVANKPEHQLVRIGDVYITGILREQADIPYYDFDPLEFSYTFFNELPCDDYFEKKPHLLICMSKLHSGNRNDPFEYYDIWDIILERHGKPNSTTQRIRRRLV